MIHEIRRIAARTYWCKRLCVWLACSVMVALLIRPLLSHWQMSGAGTASAMTVGAVSASVMQAPRIHTMNHNGQSIDIQADHAIYEGGDTIAMTQVRGHMHAPGKGPIQMEAAQGRITHERDMAFSGGVRCVLSQGYRLQTSRILVGLETDKVVAPDAVTIHHPRMQLDAEGFTATQRGEHVSFRGPVRLVFVSPAGS